MRKTLIFLCLVVSGTTLANVGGSDLQNFNPNTNGYGFITVFPSKTLAPFELNVGSFLTYTTNSLPYSTVSNTPTTQAFSNPNDQLLYTQLSFGIGLIEGWDLGVGAGFLNSQKVGQSNFLFSYGDTGIDDIRMNTKIRIYNDETMGLALATGMDFDQIQNNPFAGDNPGPNFNFDAIADIYLTSTLQWVINVGYRLRNPGTPIPNTGVTPMSDQITYSSALSYRTDDHGSAVIGEFFGSSPIEEFTIPTDRQLSNLEILLGYRWRAIQGFDLHGGIGTEVYHGLGSPDFRAYVGFNLHLDFLNKVGKDPWKRETQVRHYPKPILEDNLEQAFENDSDNDGVPDPIDQCPNTWAQNYVDERGCPRSQLPGKE